MRMKAVCGAVLCVLFVGCAQVPKPSPYPYSSQLHMQAAHHWNVLASEVAESVAESLARQDLIGPTFAGPGPARTIPRGQDTQAPRGRELQAQRGPETQVQAPRGPAVSAESIYVHSEDRYPFDRAFRSFLMTELMKRGIPVSSNQNTALRISWTVQAVEHSASRSKPTFPFGWATGPLAFLAVSPVVDPTPAMETGPLPPNEIIITTRAVNTVRDAILWHRSDVYYVHARDLKAYVHVPPPPARPAAIHKSYLVVDK